VYLNSFNGEEVTRRYTHRHPNMISSELALLRNMKTEKELEDFLVRHGGMIIQQLGWEVDRIETEIKKKAPEVKHCDLEM